MTLGANDFVLTPNGTWHEHGVEADGTRLHLAGRPRHPAGQCARGQLLRRASRPAAAVDYPVDDTTATWGGPGPAAGGGTLEQAVFAAAQIRVGPTYEALRKLAKATDGSPYDGILMNYVNPATGGPVMQTIGASMQLLRPGERTKAHRHTGSFIYQVAKGSGYSIIGGKRFDWQERDIFCVPSWAWHEHANASASEDACLFSFNDLPVMQALGLYREEAYGDNGGHQRVM